MNSRKNVTHPAAEEVPVDKLPLEEDGEDGSYMCGFMDNASLVYITKEGCRDDTMPQTLDTRRPFEVGVRGERIFCNPKMRCREGVAEECCILSLLYTLQGLLVSIVLAWYLHSFSQL